MGKKLRRKRTRGFLTDNCHEGPRPKPEIHPVLWCGPVVAHGNRGVQLRRRRRVRDSFCYPLRQRSAENSRATSGSGIHTLAPKDLEIASQKQNAPGHSWNDSLGACSPLPRAREKVWWAMRGRKKILGPSPNIGKHHSSSWVLA